jgi:hypothetical protein
MDEGYLDLLESLKWGAKLDLTDGQRDCLREYCSRIAGTLIEGEFQGPGVPTWRLKEEADKRRAAEARLKPLEARVKELERAMQSKRDEWQFRRRKRSATPPTNQPTP